MNEALISAADYDGFNQIQANAEVFENLAKALAAGDGIDPAAFTGGRAMIPENLDTDLVNVLWSQEDAKLFKLLKTQPMKTPVYQWARRTGVGNTDGAWVAEGGDSQEHNQTLGRGYVTAKYLQTKRGVTLQMQATQSLEEAEASEVFSGTLWLIQQIEEALFYGDTSIVAEQFDGLKLLTPAANVVDLRGQKLTDTGIEEKLKDVARLVRDVPNYGKLTHAFCSLGVIDDFQKLVQDRVRWMTQKGTPEGGLAGTLIDTYPTVHGNIKMNGDIFVQKGAQWSPSSITDKRPDAPTISAGIRQAATGGRVSEWITADAGAYYYVVTAVNKYGESAASAAVQVAAVVAGDEVRLTITDGATVGTGYRIYRSAKDAADGTAAQFIFEITHPTGAPIYLYDLNAWLPGMSEVFFVGLDAGYVPPVFGQFLPMMRFQLYPTNAAINPFLMLLFGALVAEKAEGLAMFKNVDSS